MMNSDQLIHDLLYRTVYKISQDKDLDNKAKMKALFHLFNMLLEEATKDEEVSFTTLFSRIAYTGSVHQLESQLLYYLHTFRRANEQNKLTDANIPHYLDLGYYVINTTTAAVWQPQEEKEFDLSEETILFFRRAKRDVIQFTPLIECLVTAVDIDAFTLDFIDESDGSVIEKAYFDISDKNEIFNRNIQALHKFYEMPIHANLVDVEVLVDGRYIPQALVIKPDHLVDVTAVAETFKYYGTDALLYMVNKFRQKESSPPLMIGNIANYFLDVLVSNPDADYKELEPMIFHMSPIEFTLYDDQTVIDMLRKIEIHFLHLQKVVKEDFPRHNIDRSKSYLEPSFLSRAYGLQGRLDMLHYDDATQRYDIIELKSGKPFRTNTYGLNNNHYVQTLLYDLLIKSAFGSQLKINSYILYSALDMDQLRYAPPVKAQQYEAMRIRNDLMTLEQNLGNAHLPDSNVLSYLKLDHFPKASGYDKKAVEEFEKVYANLDIVEKAYLEHYVAFIAREQSLSKTGEHGLNRSNGHAALWLENVEEKEERFAILNNLQVIKNDAENDPPILILKRGKNTNPLANFRKGDIAILYPVDISMRGVLSNQVFKCTILEIDEHQVTIRLRSQQYNHGIFRKYAHWNIEEDSMDSGFNTMYRSLYKFCTSPKPYRDLMLSKAAPQSVMQESAVAIESLTSEQNQILNKMIDAKDYYLLWGPPGTGKTSVMLRHLVEHISQEQKQTVLVLAYTNRAVDEICASIKAIKPEDENLFIRIGSSYSCGEEYKPTLLRQRIVGMKRRSEISQLLTNTNLYISTVSSIINRTDLLKMKQFDTIIIDEASQILEPMLVGLLSHAKRFILIGDHKQLPAVVVQGETKTKVVNEALLERGIVDQRMSLFERLYLRCNEQGWNHVIGILSQQGRMHQDIMKFPNEHFYGGQLLLLSKLARLSETKPYMVSQSHPWISERCIYIDTPVDSYYSWKTNDLEAKLTKQLIEIYQAEFVHNDMPLTKGSLGVITPYRAQIAMIKEEIKDMDRDETNKITIDTVERYQGGARDVIIISLCTNKLSQLDSLVSLSTEGVDRKLNVALTRAKEQIIILGNREILSENPTYLALIDSYFQLGYEEVKVSDIN